MTDTRSIERLLIANRGEIAVRIARTAHRLGISTVGVYSEPDVGAVHADAVDLAVALGGSSPSESYLRGDVVLAAALDTGCDAVHPGYGFLAENADFAQQVIDAGLRWVGPTPTQIRLLGDKVAAKRAAVDAGVPTTPAVTVEPGSEPEGVTFPALVKAAAGGGGRGMRIVSGPGDLSAAIESARREAEAAFGDGTLFIEPYVEAGRHVEVQILGDAHGAIVHLGERECSIQRRNQKIIEESPSAGISADVREALWRGALDLGRHVAYENAGTVEFLVGPDGTITFLEVNTRLQVEHPVTEAVTDLDLVELQLRVAAGEPLPISQPDITFEGHAIEARVVAEDPAAGWLPSTGTLAAFGFDSGDRVDSGVTTGSVVSTHYDSLLAKVITHGATRAEAARRLARTVRTARIGGVATNLPVLAAILTDEDFLAARTPTSYLDDHADLVRAAIGAGDEDHLAHLVGAVLATEQLDRAADPVTGFAPSGWRNLRVQGQRQRWQQGNDDHSVELVADGDRMRLLVGPWPEPTDDGTLPPDDRRDVTVRRIGGDAGRQTLEIDGKRWVIDLTIDGDTVHTHSPAGSLTWTARPRFVDHQLESVGGGPTCPLPGTVIAVHVEAGRRVEDGELLMVVEAMKMEHKITAAGAAIVADVRYQVGDRVDSGDLLVALDPVE